MKTTNEVMLRTSDLEEAKAYYNGQLGLTIVLENDRVVGFDTGAFNLYFERGEPNGAVFEIAVDDVARAKERFMAAGCQLLEENPSIPRVYLCDRFGLIFNISQA